MACFLLLDIGSTFTKALAVDVDTGRVLGQAQAATTAAEDVRRGVDAALAALTPQCGLALADFDRRLACSSAAGGLSLAAVGLAPEFTTEAARQAALGAGAKVTDVFAGELTEADIARLAAQRPDLLLLCGGTDGGDERTVRHNATVLSQAHLSAAVIYAGNQAMAAEVERCLQAAGQDVTVVENVLPELYRLNVEPARAAIREVFLRRIIHAKGLDAVTAFVDAPILPTPLAVLRAAELLAEGTSEEPGLGHLLVVDVGGATTDVHSVAEEPPLPPGWIRRGLPEPRVKRTVEGDLGLRVNAETLLREAEIRSICNLQFAICNLQSEICRYAAQVSRQVDHVPNTEAEAEADALLARAAVELAVRRHVGTVEELSTPAGQVFRQHGKDLSAVAAVVGTGGIFAHTRHARWLLAPAARGSLDHGTTDHGTAGQWSVVSGRWSLLRPLSARCWVDRSYCLWAGGLLSEVAPTAAFRLMWSSLEEI